MNDIVRMEDRAAHINAGHAAIIGAARFLVLAYIEEGRLLCEAKRAGKEAGKVVNGRGKIRGNTFRWQPWIDDNLTFDLPQAWRYMEAYRLREEILLQKQDFYSLESCLASVKRSLAPPDDHEDVDDFEPESEPKAEQQGEIDDDADAESAGDEEPGEDEPEAPESEDDEEGQDDGSAAERQARERAEQSARYWSKVLDEYCQVFKSIRKIGGPERLCETWTAERIEEAADFAETLMQEASTLRDRLWRCASERRGHEEGP